VKTLDGTGGLLVVFSTLQPVDEAAGVIRDYYLFFLAFGLVISLVLAYAISHQITRPVIHINTVATKISRLDFTQQCIVSGNDELSELAKTVNRLSENMSGALTDLRETNSKLNIEIEHQKELDILRKRFVAGVSHELKTPLSIIKGYSEGLIDNTRDGVANAEYAAIIQDEVDHMEHIITDMLDLSQMEAGRYSLELEPVAINRLLKYEIRKIRPYFDKKELNLILDIPEDQVIVNVDGRRIQQVISNLLNNAIRYTPRNGVIKITLSSISGEVKVEIENTCPEYSDTDLEHIWDDFYRMDPSHNRDSGGSGLGLSVVKSILDLHNSQYGVHKTITGLNFYFVLQYPLKQDAVNLE
jgi:signal transduction histidine kinase